MNEEQLAEFFERRRGDTSHWSDAPVEAKIRRRGGVVFSVRFSPEELLLLRERARDAGTTISELVRSAAIDAATSASMVYTLTIDRQLPRLSARCPLAVNWTSARNGTAEPTVQPGDPPGRYVFGDKGTARSGSTGHLVPV